MTDLRQRMVRARVGWGLLLAIVLIAAAMLRVHGIGRDSLWGDEVLSVTIARLPLHDLVTRVIDWEQIPPVHHLLLHFWIKLFGDSEVSVRMPSAIAGVAGVFMTYVLVRRLMGRRVALTAATLLAVSPMHVAYSGECRTYALAVLVALVSMDLFVRLLRRPSPRLSAAWIVVSALLLYTHLYGIFTLATQHLVYAVVCVHDRRHGRRARLSLRQWFLSNLAVALLFGPWVPVVRQWTRLVAVSFWVKQQSLHDITRAYWTYSGSVLGFVLFLSLVIVCFWLRAWPHRAPRRRGLGVLLALTFVPVVVPVVYAVLTHPSFAPRYSIVACVGWCGVAAAGIAAIRPAALRWLTLAVAVGVSVAAIGGPATRIPRAPWRDACNYLLSRIRPGDVPVVHIKASWRVFDYYVRRPDLHRLAFDTGAIPLSLPLRPGQRVWFAMYEEWAPLKAILGRGPWRVVSHRRFGEVLVTELDDDFPPGLREEIWPGSGPSTPSTPSMPSMPSMPSTTSTSVPSTPASPQPSAATRRPSASP